MGKADENVNSWEELDDLIIEENPLTILDFKENTKIIMYNYQRWKIYLAFAFQ